MAKLLRNYEDKYGLNTISGLIGRWAPPNENDTDSYVRSVSDRTGLPADYKLDFTNENEVGSLVKAIIHHENGQQPYDDTTVGKGVRMAMGDTGRPSG
jgi:hypothetical protein